FITYKDDTKNLRELQKLKMSRELGLITEQELLSTSPELPHRLIVQLESLHKYFIGGKSYDYVILDESQSILAQFSSEKTMNGRLYENLCAFKHFITTAIK